MSEEIIEAIAKFLYKEHCDGKGWFQDKWEDEPDEVHQIYTTKATLLWSTLKDMNVRKVEEIEADLISFQLIEELLDKWNKIDQSAMAYGTDRPDISNMCFDVAQAQLAHITKGKKIYREKE